MKKIKIVLSMLLGLCMPAVQVQSQTEKTVDSQLAVIQPDKEAEQKIEVLMSSYLLSQVPLDVSFVNSMSITPNRNVLLSSKNQFYLLGWGGIMPYGVDKIGDISSFSYTNDNLLFTVRNKELCIIDSLGQFSKIYDLPNLNMALSAGKELMYLYDKAGTNNKNGLYIIAKGRRFTKLLEMPTPINAIFEQNDSLLFASGNKLFMVDMKTKQVKALVSLPQVGKEIVSITFDPDKSTIYFSTNSAIYTLKSNLSECMTDKFGGSLTYLDRGLLVFDSDKKMLIRIMLDNNTEPIKPVSKPLPSSKNEPEIITNASIINLVKNKVSDDFIIELISLSEPNFDMSVNGMVELSKQGVSSNVIMEMKKAMKKKAVKGQ